MWRRTSFKKDRKLIEKAWGIKALNYYATSESLMIGIKRPQDKNMYLMDDLNYLEIKKNKTIITNLYNYTQPLIRYELSDILEESKNQERNWPFREVENIIGRREEMIWFNNENGNREFLHPIVLAEFYVKGLKKFQIMKSIMKNQLKVARNLQKTIINTELPQGLEGEGFYRPVLKSGGDFYDFVEIENGKYGYLLADNKRQGISAILIMIALKFIFEKLDHKTLTPGEVLKQIDSKLKEKFSEDLSEIKITLCYIIIDSKNKKISWANAGHPYPLLIDNQNNWLGLEFTTSALTKDSEIDLEYKEIDYKNESRVFSYTDGLADFLTSEEDFLAPEIIEDIVSEFAPGRSGKSEFYEWLIAKLDNIEYYDNICYTLINL